MSEQEARRGRQSKSLIRNEECVRDRSSSSFPHATLSVQPTLKGSTQRHRPRPSRPQNACIYATHHNHQKPNLQKHHKLPTNVSARTKEPIHHSKHTSIPPRRKDLDTPCRFQPQEDRQPKGKEEGKRIWDIRKKASCLSVNNKLFFRFRFDFLRLLLCFSAPYP